MTKKYTSLGLMSGTSGDGVDASIIQSNGDKKYKLLLDNWAYPSNNISHQRSTNTQYKSHKKTIQIRYNWAT